MYEGRNEGRKGGKKGGRKEGIVATTCGPSNLDFLKGIYTKAI
jgi:hypothetical protein